MLIEWSDKLSIGIDEIDEDHQLLLSIINNFHDRFLQSQPKEATLKALSEIAEYTSWHFEHEERIMYANKYPQIEEHQGQHTELLENLTSLVADFEKERADITEVTMNFLRDWLLIHLQRADYELGKWVRRRNFIEELF